MIRIELKDPKFLAGVVIARGVKVADAPAALAEELRALVARRAAEDFPPPPLKEAVRALLRRGGFKPAGRNKPASEYLAQAAREGRFPSINNLVDVNNLLSLESGLPISLLDLAAVGDAPVLRYGDAGEKYVFNGAGQDIDLAGLICVCAASREPLGNAIKDSMRGKLKPETTDVLGVAYGTEDALPEPALRALMQRFGELLSRHGGARSVESAVVRG